MGRVGKPGRSLSAGEAGAENTEGSGWGSRLGGSSLGEPVSENREGQGSGWGSRVGGSGGEQGSEVQQGSGSLLR